MSEREAKRSREPHVTDLRDALDRDLLGLEVFQERPAKNRRAGDALTGRLRIDFLDDGQRHLATNDDVFGLAYRFHGYDVITFYSRCQYLFITF